MDREALITRKQSVRQQIERHQRELEQLHQAQPPNLHRVHNRVHNRVRKVEAELEALMSEEYALRLAIDRH